MKLDMTMDWAWGSCGKGGITGWMALRNRYDTVMCAYGTQAGHTYNNSANGIRMMVQQLPVGIISPTVKTVMIGPGALIHAATIMGELDRYGGFMLGKRLMIHEHAAVVEDYHAQIERSDGMSKIGSTTKGVGQAAIDRIRRNPDMPNCARQKFRGTALEPFIVDRFEYIRAIQKADNILVEGAQGFCLSIYHGDYPYVTSRDVTPWQIAADCGLPFASAQRINTIGVCRTFPIRVNNRDGTSGPAYPGQREMSWEELGRPAELTTVTKLPRRVFEFSLEQIRHAHFHCGQEKSSVVLTFADYCSSFEDLDGIINEIQSIPGVRVSAVVFGPDDRDVVSMDRDLGSNKHAILHRWEKTRDHS